MIWGSDKETFEGWLVIELLGHRRLAGFVREVTIAGAGFLQIDVPGPDGSFTATQFVPPSSVYALTPTTEETARRLAQLNRPEPVKAWELPPSARVTACKTQMQLPGMEDEDEYGDPFADEEDLG